MWGGGEFSSVISRFSGPGFWSLLFQEAVKADSTSRFKKQTRFVDDVYKWILKGLGRIIPAGPLLLLVCKTGSWAR